MEILTLDFPDNNTTTEGATRECAQCKKDISAMKPNAKFCSQRCRNAANNGIRYKKLKGVDKDSQDGQDNAQDDVAQDQKPASASSSYTYDDDYEQDDKPMQMQPVLKGNLNGMNAQSQYIITHQRDMINDLKEERRRLRDKLERITNDRNDLSKKMDRIELEREFKVAEKSGLNGITSNPIVKSIIDAFAPHAAEPFAKWMDKKLNGGSIPALEGVNTDDKEVMEQLEDFTQFYVKLPKEQQMALYQMLFALSSDQEKFVDKLTRINTMLANGTTIRNHQKQYAGAVGY